MPSQTFTHTTTSPSGHTNTSTATVDTAHFTLTTAPGTDIWRPSSTQSRFDAPHLTTSIRSGSFKSLTCTVSGPWRTKFDQGGLLCLWPSPSGQDDKSKWLKTGIEFFEGRAAVSVVGTDRFSDWSLSPLPAGSKDGEVTVRVERDGDTLWVYALRGDGGKTPLREIKWAWMEGREADAELLVGVCAAKPAEGDGEGDLEVTFRDWVLETRE